MPTTVSVSEYGAAAPVVGMVTGAVPVNPLAFGIAAWMPCKR